LSSRVEKKFKRDREDENNPVFQPEVEHDTKIFTALWVAKGFVTEPVLTIEIGGEEFLFMLDTDAMVSLIQSGISKARCNRVMYRIGV